MNNSFRLALEGFKKDCRFKIGLPPEQAETLFQQIRPIADELKNFKSKVVSIRKNNMLSDSGKAAEVDQARTATLEQIVEYAAKIDRTEIISDLARRVNQSVRGSREKAQKSFSPDAALLAQEIRQHILPGLVREGKNMQISPARTAEKMALKAAEQYSTDPAKMETVIGALSVGWPWCPDLPEGTLAQVEAVIAGQVASEEQAALLQAQGVQALLTRTIEAAQKELRELG